MSFLVSFNNHPEQNNQLAFGISDLPQNLVSNELDLSDGWLSNFRTLCKQERTLAFNVRRSRRRTVNQKKKILQHKFPETISGICQKRFLGSNDTNISIYEGAMTRSYFPAVDLDASIPRLVEGSG